MTAAYQVRIVFHEEGQDQHPDVHSVIIGIGCNNDAVVAQVIHVIFHSKGIDEQVELFIFSHSLAAFLVAVDRFSPEAEHCLRVCPAGFGDGSACRVSLCDEYAGQLTQFFL